MTPRPRKPALPPRQHVERVFRAAMRVHDLNGAMNDHWVHLLHPVDREFYRACAAARAARVSRPKPKRAASERRGRKA